MNVVKCAKCKLQTMTPTGNKYPFTVAPVDADEYDEYQCTACGYKVGRKPDGTASRDKRYRETIPPEKLPGA